MLIAIQKKIIANNKWHVLRICFITILFSYTGCSLIGLGDDKNCKDTEADEFELYIKPNTYFVYQNGEPCEGYDIKFEIYKTYCNGDISGQYSVEVKTNDEGYANFGMLYTYKFGNIEDIVTFAYTVTYGTKHIVEKVITYDFAKNNSLDNGDQKRAMDLYWDYFGKEPVVVPWNP